MSSSQEILITLFGGTFLLLFLVVVVIVAAARYQNRKRIHLMEIQKLAYENEQQLLKTKLEVQDKTLTDVSREIHDNIGQILSVVKLNLHTLKLAEVKTQSQVITTIDLVDRAISDLRNLSKVLNTDFIAHQPLSYLLQREIEVINKAGIFEIAIKCECEEIDLPPDQKLVLFRIAQECLQNAIKHSNATKIIIEFKFTETHCLLCISDNGIGFNYDLVKNGNGFTNLRTRSSLIQATFDLQTKPQAGTRVNITVPLS